MKKSKKKKEKKGKKKVRLFGSLLLKIDEGGKPFDYPVLPDDAMHWSLAKGYLRRVVTVYGHVKSKYIESKRFEYLVDNNVLEPGLRNHLVSIAVGESYPIIDLAKEVIWGKDWIESPVDRDDTLVVLHGETCTYNGRVYIRINDPNNIKVFDPTEDVFVNPGIVNFEKWERITTGQLGPDGFDDLGYGESEDSDIDYYYHDDYYGPYNDFSLFDDYIIDGQGRRV